MKKSVFCISVLLLVVLTGCVQYDYVGQSFPPNENGTVTFYEKENAVPRENLLLIGRMTMTCDEYLDKYEVEEKLMEKARQYGADAVSIVSETKVAENTQVNEAMAEFSSSDIDPAGEDAAGVPYQVNSFGKVVVPPSPAVYDWIIKAHFWKNRSDAVQEIEKRKDIRKDVIPVVQKVQEPSEPEKPESLQE